MPSRLLKLKNLFKKISTHQDGVSLIQILMASTAIAGLALVGLKLSEDQKKLVQKTYNKYLTRYLIKEIEYQLRDKAICTTSMKGKKTDGLKFKSLRKSKIENSKETIHILFPSSYRQKEKEGHYFYDKLELLYYETVDDAKGLDPDRGTTGIKIKIKEKRITKDPDEHEKVVFHEKIFPLNVVLSESGRIESCFLQASRKGIVEGSWYRAGDYVQLNGVNVSIGDNLGARHSVKVRNTIGFEVEKNEPKCEAENDGVIYHWPKGRLSYCQLGKLHPFGSQRLRWEDAKSYSLQVTSVGSQKKMSDYHRFCFKVRMKKNNEADGCRLRRLSTDVLSIYEMIIYSNYQSNVECEVRCVD